MVNGSTDERLLSIFLAKSMAAIFYFNDSGRLGIERNLYQEGVNGQNKERGGGSEDCACLGSLLFYKTLFVHKRSS